MSFRDVFDNRLKVFEIVKQEMKMRSKLIEHAAQRIASSLKTKISKIEKVEVKLTKIAPPVNGDLGSVTFSCEL